MTDLSPAAIAVDDALAACIQLQGEIVRARPLAAAALEAVASLIKMDNPLGGTDAEAGVFAAHHAIRSDLLAIAAELRGATTTKEDN